MFPNEMVWENIETFGCEYLYISRTEHMIQVESTVISLETGFPVQIWYQMTLNHSWKITKVHIIDKNGPSLQLTSTGTGVWYDHHGVKLDYLNGAIDIDISATPFSNSLPIKRHTWDPGQKREIDMIYVSIPSLDVQKVKQTYTYIERENEDRVFHFQHKEFTSFISVDENGYVTEYPGLFTRRY